MPPERLSAVNRNEKDVTQVDVRWSSDSDPIAESFSEDLVTKVPEGESLFDEALVAVNDNHPPAEPPDIWSDAEKAQIATYMREEVARDEDAVEASSEELTEASIDTPEERAQLQEDMEDRVLDQYITGTWGEQRIETIPVYLVLEQLTDNLSAIDGTSITDEQVEQVQGTINKLYDYLEYPATVYNDELGPDDPSGAWAALQAGQEARRKDLAPEDMSDDSESVPITNNTQLAATPESSVPQPRTEYEAINAAWADVESTDVEAVAEESVEADEPAATPDDQLSPEASLRATLDEVGQSSLEPDVWGEDESLTQSEISEPAASAEPAPTPEAEPAVPSISKRAVLAEIDKIETVGRGWFNFGDTASPSVVFGHMPFAYFADMTSMNKRDFNTWLQNEFKGVNVQYEALKKWADRMPEIIAFAGEAYSDGMATTQEVLEGYVEAMLEQSAQRTGLFR